MRRVQETPEEVCARKIKYESNAAATDNKRAMKRDDLWVYLCPLGDHWHLGHPSRRMILGRLVRT